MNNSTGPESDSAFQASKIADIDFSSVLAATVHDMKNSLSLLIQSIEHLEHHVPTQYQNAHDHISQTHYEASRLNSNLVQLLSLYRSDLNNLPLAIDECHIRGFLEDICAANEYYCRQRKIAITIDCAHELRWFLDEELFYLLINDAVINALRYGKKQVLLSAHAIHINHREQLLIKVEDDGQGYPEHMVSDHIKGLSTSNVKNGRTGLGLFFARIIAHAHEHQENRGEISLSNGGSLGGSVFTVKLP